ncbi:MAG TPA: hypothetical protein VD997_10990 [Phycisphaerales bacterium]|nr:hypothetical protein [Phycisphaerales bacterium]
MSDAAPNQVHNEVRPVAPVLTPEQLRELDEARRRWRKVARAGRVAMVDGCFLASGAAFSLLLGLWSVESAVAGVMLAGLAAVEFMGRARLKRAEPQAALLLGWNQLLILGLIGGACFYQIFFNAPPPAAPSPYLTDPAVKDLLEANGYGGLLEAAQDQRPLRTLVYCGVAVSALLTQGVLALYYFSRHKVVEAYLRATPAWVVEVQRRGA